MFVNNERLRIVGVSRGSEYSPNHVDNDAAIFCLTARELEKHGCDIRVFSEKDFVSMGVEADYIFDMARDKATISLLKSMEDKGAIVVNSAYGIENCSRRPMTEKLIENGIPHPESYIISTDEEFLFGSFPYWIKRGDSHAIVREDVIYVECREEAELVLADFRKRGIGTAVINEHLVGDLIKFYGVAGTDFFFSFYPTEQSHSKFGLEAINGENRGYPFDEKTLKKYADKAAQVLNVPIYGGDCVVSSDGTIRIIDFNDWPSFARCRNEAAPYIAECIIKEIAEKSGNINSL